MTSKKRTFVGYTPFAHQMAVHQLLENAKGTGLKVIVKSRRQVGKSVMAENECLRFGIKHPNTVTAIVSPVLSQSRKLFKDIVNATAGTGAIRKSNESLLEITLCNGSQILFKSGQQKDTLRGYTVDFLILDEAAYLPDDILELVLPWTNVRKAPILVISTPKLRTGLFYTWYTQGQMEEYPNIQSVDWNDYDTSALLSKEQIEEYRRLMPSGQFRTEILGEFVEDGSGVFPINANTYTSDGNGTGRITFGIDFANGEGGDYTVISGLYSNGKQALLEYCKDKTPIQQVEWLTNILTKYKGKIGTVIAEKNSMGHTYIDLLRLRNVGINIVEFVTSNTTKREIIEDLAKDIGMEEVILFDDPEQRLQLSAYRMEITKGGKITYNGYLANDDIVMADALANYGRTKRAGNYVVSGIKK